jgi:uncharacterized RDD family membrane protein YckC
MAVDQDEVSRVLAVLAHPLRREILSSLDEKRELSFTDIMNAIKVDTGKLSFHIRNLNGFIEQTETGKYKLTRIGEHAMGLLRDLETWVSDAGSVRRNPMNQLANLKKRALAFLMDFGLILAVFVIPGVIPSVFTGRGLGLTINDLILFFVIFWVYSTLLEGFAGQSLGKRIMRLRVVRTDGKKPSYDQAAIRNFGKIIPVLPFDMLLGLRLKDERFVRYFDKFAGTTVVDLEPQSRSSEKAQSELRT